MTKTQIIVFFFLHVPVLVTVSILYLEFNFLFQKTKS